VGVLEKYVVIWPNVRWSETADVGSSSDGQTQLVLVRVQI